MTQAFRPGLFLGRHLATCLALLLSFAAAQAQELQPIDYPVAVVEEDLVLKSELDVAVHNIRAQYADRPDQLPPNDVLERQVLERLIITKLQVERAIASGIRTSDQDVDIAISRIAAGNNLTPDQLREQVAATGQTWDQFRATIRDEMLIQQLRQSFAQGRIQVSDSEVDAALAAQAGNAQYHLANILVALPDGATADQIATAQKKIEGIKGVVDRGELDFSAAAVRYSDAQNALEGGDLGWRGLDEIPPSFANMIRTMELGQVLGPIRGPSGFQLVMLLEQRDAADEGAAPVTEFHARHILARVDGTHPEAQARAKIDTLSARLAGGADFETLARESSDDENTRAQGGDLGWFDSDRFGITFASQLAALADGGISKPFRTDAGWHIVQRVATRQGASDQGRRAQMREAIGRRKLEDEYTRFLREMRGEAFVELRNQPDAPEAQPQPPANGG